MDFTHINIITFNIVYSIYKKYFGGHGNSDFQFNFHSFIFVSPTPATTFSCQSGEKSSHISPLSMHHYSAETQCLT